MEQTKNAIPTVAGWLNTWLEVYVKGKNKRNTFLCYQHIIKTLLKHQPFLVQCSLKELTEIETQKILNEFAEHGYAKSTLEKVRTVLSQSYIAAIRNQLCSHNPASGTFIPTSPTKTVPALTAEQQKLVEQAALQDPLGHIVFFFLNTGLRSKELMDLKWEDYSPEKQCIFIRESKTKAGIRCVPLIETAQRILDAQPKISTYIFTSTTKTPLTKTVLKRLYQRIQQKTGLHFVTNHVYRHTFATRLVEHRVDYTALSQLLGHTNVSFTLQRYVHPDEIFLKQQINLLSSQNLSDNPV